MCSRTFAASPCEKQDFKRKWRNTDFSFLKMCIRSLAPTVYICIYIYIYIVCVCVCECVCCNTIEFVRKQPQKNYQSFIYSPNDKLVSCLNKNIKNYITLNIKTAPTCIGVTVTPSSRCALIWAY